MEGNEIDQTKASVTPPTLVFLLGSGSSESEPTAETNDSKAKL